jgi:alanyl-tRNA synthetase
MSANPPLSTGTSEPTAYNQCTSASGSGVATPTEVTYPSGSLEERATVVEVLDDPRPAAGPRVLVITDVTPFHPLDPLWPDQPADHGELLVGEVQHSVSDTVTVARRTDGPLMVDYGIDARRDEPGVVFRVAHSLGPTTGPRPAAGDRVTLVVDPVRRARLNAAHTACHLLAYALNAATHDLWSKPTAFDSRGHHDFDRATCVHTRHDVDGSVDRYRLGKSLRKLGFDSARFFDELPGIIERINVTLAEWIRADSAVRIHCEGTLLTDRREWVCELPGGTAHMPCGGTHVSHLAELVTMHARADFDAEGSILTITNATRPALRTAAR